MGCFNGESVALEMRDNMKKGLCMTTVEQLHTKCPNLNEAILHIDRGSQYTSENGHCFDNARMESFFAALKKEKLYKDGAYKLTREEVKTMIFRYVFVYYNCVRIYTANPFGLPPVKYREWMDGWRRYR